MCEDAIIPEELPPNVQETMKVLKRLGMPEVQSSTKASTVLPKMVQALTKRLTKLEECRASLAAPDLATPLVQKTLVWLTRSCDVVSVVISVCAYS